MQLPPEELYPRAESPVNEVFERQLSGKPLGLLFGLVARFEERINGLNGLALVGP
jgi:hypothetical protein